jgi:undecaprenyl diphosphate synthase
MADPTSGSPSAVPVHVAIVMDGNGRWAKKRFLPRIAGHHQGVDALRNVVRWSQDKGVQVLTVFAFSSENWKRPKEEVSGLMALMAKTLASEVSKLSAEGVRLRFPGDWSVLSEPVRSGLAQAQDSTRHNTRLQLNVCFNYGGRWDIVQAARQLVESGEAVTESALAARLSMADLPDPDLVIRTGGELRISNFLLWQVAYSEFYFSDKLWPAFDEAEYDRALSAYAARERRFGQVDPADQVSPAATAAGPA